MFHSNFLGNFVSFYFVMASSRVSQILKAEMVVDPLVNILKSGCSSENMKEKVCSLCLIDL